MTKAIIFDLDGTVFRGDEEVPGASAFVKQQQHNGVRCFFVTNRSNRTSSVICEQLQGYGISCREDDILTSSQATAAYIKTGSVFYIGEDGLRQPLEEAGLTFTQDSPDYVVVGFDRLFTYDKMATACQLIDAGATFIATNPDKCLKMVNGLTPGTGAIVAAVAAGSEVDPVVIGKPERLIFDMALARLELQASEVIALGDNLETDVLAGNRVGMPTALILTGVSTRAQVAESSAQPTWVVEDYQELAAIV
ncbi:MAG: HAD-IIA family hydrolase [Kiritimatiellae bacterium]|nr:HAD-IIA family hydrolase [Kiritimatiellia bacterium]